MDAPGIRLRESPRIEIAGKARLRLGSAAALIDAALLDLSATGMGLATGVAAPKPVAGEQCAFDFAFDGVRVEGRGVVIWSRRARPDRGDAPNVGVRFHELEGAGESEVAAIVEQGLASARRHSVVARAIFEPVVERAVEPAVVAQTEVAEPVLRSEPVKSAPVAPMTPAFEPREKPAAAGAGAPLPTRRLSWIGLAVAAVVVAGLLLMRSFLGGERVVAPPAVAVAGEPELVEVAAVLPTSGELEVGSEAKAITADLATLPDAVAADPQGGAPAEVAPAAALAAAPDVAPAVAPDTERASTGLEARARRLLAIEPGTGEGGEVVVLRADAPFREQDVFAALIGPDPPRYLLRLSGIERPWRPADLEVGAALVRRVRSGLHSTPRGPELHIVLDLSTRAVDHSFEVGGDVLRVHLRPRAP